MKLTLEYLEQHDACQSGIDFAQRNGLIGQEIDLDKVEGDWNEFVEWLRTRPHLEFDHNGNRTRQVYLNGNELCWEYD